jgi:hypothetical protein
MFTIIFKLVGYDISSGEHDYKVTIDEPHSFLTEKHIIDSFTIPGVIDIDTINMIRFIYKGATLSFDKTHILVENGDDITIHVFTSFMDIRRKLVENIFISLKIFLEEKNSLEEEISHEMIEEKEIMTDDVIQEMNNNIVKLFSDKDFTDLLRIILNKPHLLNIASSYIQHGDVVKVDSVASDFTYIEQYDKVIDIMEKLNVDIIGFEDEIKSLLFHFKGHINLTLRSILLGIFDL